MGNRNEQRKIKEARYFILIPLAVSAICAWLDVLTNYTAGQYAKEVATLSVQAVFEGTTFLDNVQNSTITVEVLGDYNRLSTVASVIRCCMGYLFPSLVSIAIVLIWQQSQSNLSSDVYALNARKVGSALIATVLYAVVFVTCLIIYNIWTAILLCCAMILYVCWFYKFGLDDRIKPKSKNDMQEEELLSLYINKK